MSQQISELTDHLGYWLRLVSNHVSHSFAHKLADIDVTAAEWVMLRSLYRKVPMAPSLLAEEMGVTRGAVTKLADRLIAKTLVVRRSSSADGAFQSLALTKQGLALVPQLASLADQNEAECFGHLSMAQRRVLERTLNDLVLHFGLTGRPLS